MRKAGGSHYNLETLQKQGLSRSPEALALHSDILDALLSATFDVDSALGRIDTEASYMSEDRYQVQVHDQHEATVLNLVTFAASGALGAAGNAMQLTTGLNHAGVALSAAAGGAALGLTAVQSITNGGKREIRSPYNMLATMLDCPPNTDSQYPPLILAYLQLPSGRENLPLKEGLTRAWYRLHRLQAGKKSAGAPIGDMVADRTSAVQLSADELADREAMLHDLHASLLLLKADLHQVLLAAMQRPAPAP